MLLSYVRYVLVEAFNRTEQFLWMCMCVCFCHKHLTTVPMSAPAMKMMGLYSRIAFKNAITISQEYHLNWNLLHHFCVRNMGFSYLDQLKHNTIWYTCVCVIIFLISTSTFVCFISFHFYFLFLSFVLRISIKYVEKREGESRRERDK